MSAACPTFGFLVAITPREARHGAEVRALVDDLIVTVEPAGLVVTRRASHILTVSRDGSQATHADRELVMRWAERWTERAHVDVGDLIDLEH